MQKINESDLAVLEDLLIMVSTLRREVRDIRNELKRIEPVDGKWMPIHKVMQEYNRSRDTVLRWVRDGEWERKMVGGVVYVRPRI